MKASNGREGRLVCGCGCTGQELLRSGGVLSLPGKCHYHCNCRCQASEKLNIRKEREESMYARQIRILLFLFIIHYLQTCWGSRETLSILQQGMPTSQRRDVGGGSVAYCGSRDNGALVSPTWHGFSTPRANALTPSPPLHFSQWSWRARSLDHSSLETLTPLAPSTAPWRV